MEEDDAAAILTRKLLLTHPFFKKDNSISKTKGFAMPTNDLKSFSTIECLYEITKVIINYKQLYPKATLIKRFDDQTRENLYNKNVLPFWEFVFNTFPELAPFIDGKLKDKKFIRNSENGGSYILRPEGQLIIAELYKHFENKGLKQFGIFKKKFSKIDFSLSAPLWRYLIWTGEKMNSRNKPLKKNLFLYLLGEENININTLKEALDKIYKEHNFKQKTQIKAIVL